MKNKILLAILLLIPAAMTAGAAEQTDGFHTCGTKLLDAKNNEFVIRGFNYSYAWQTDKWGFAFYKAREAGCNAMRIQLGNGRKFGYTDENTVRLLIQSCKDNRMIAVLNVQDPLGSNDIADLDAATDYWLGIKDAVVGQEKYMILNIANEWVSGWEEQAGTWRDGYVKAVRRLRDAGIKNTIMIDCAGYGQYPDVIWDKGRDVLDADPLHNIMFSIHFYEHASYEDFATPSGSKIKTAIDNALSAGAPLCIGEFGYARKGGAWKVDWETIVSYCCEKDVGYLGWSLTGNGEGDGCLDMFDDNGNMLYNGRCIIEGEYGIRATAKTCTVYTDEATADIPTTDKPYEGTPAADVLQYLTGSDVKAYKKVAADDRGAEVTISNKSLMDAGLTTGKIIRIMLTGTDDSSFASYMYGNEIGEDALLSGSDRFSIANWKYIDIVYTCEMSRMLRYQCNKNLIIRGHGFGVEGVYVITPAEPQSDRWTAGTVKVRKDINHQYNSGDWGDELWIKGTDDDGESMFKDVAGDDVIRIYYSNAGGQISVKDGRFYDDGHVDGNGWYISWLQGYDSWNGTVDYDGVSGSGTIDIAVSDKAYRFSDYKTPQEDATGMVEHLRKYGIMVNGHDWTLDRIELLGTVRSAGTQLKGCAEFKHNLQSSIWKPISLPYNLTEEQVAGIFGEGTQIRSLDDTDIDVENRTMTINFKEERGIEACRPYLIKAGQDGSMFRIETVKADVRCFDSKREQTADGRVCFISTAPIYNKVYDNVYTSELYNDLPEGSWYFYNGNLYKSTNEKYIKSGLAYIIISTDMQAKGFTPIMNDGYSTTGIKNTVNGATSKYKGIYSLQGIRLGRNITESNAPKGIYITNGRKTMNKY